MILFQLGILAFMVFSATRPLRTGEPITLKVRPIDPRDLMRGNYVVLDYDFSSVDLSEVDNDLLEHKDLNLKKGDFVYVLLEPRGDYHRMGKIAFQQPSPDDFPFIKARITYINRGGRKAQLRLNAGIDSYYTDKETALAMEQSLWGREIDRVHVMVTRDGEARIKEMGEAKVEDE